ncbi:TetR/AcrR family transcriptional regulator [Pseudonocardia sp.]|uniref:TetR/AcrR family transcriptional regulator n=1 Tax=Pseudonocardia sp. TaxID=60912 RepID=UPI003D14860D
MPKLWTDTVDSHRRAVRDAALDAASELLAERGPRGVTMSRVAEKAGIGRATLYKYFPDVDAVVRAWHEREVAAHLAQLGMLRDAPGTPIERLEAVLRAYASLARRSHTGGEATGPLHADDHVVRGRHQVRDMVCDLLSAARGEGDVREDVPVAELAAFCLHALGAAGPDAPEPVVQRLMLLIMSALRVRR